MSHPFVTPGGLRLVSAEGVDSLTLRLDLRAVFPRDRSAISNAFLRDCLAAAAAMPARRATTVGQAAIHALRLPGDASFFSVALIPPHNRLRATERFEVAAALAAAFAERGYRLFAADLARWASAPGLDAAAIAAGRAFLAQYAGPADTRLIATDPALRLLLG